MANAFQMFLEQLQTAARGSWKPNGQVSDSPVVTSGNPSLTQAHLDDFREFLAWYADSPVPEELWQGGKDLIVRGWTMSDPLTVKTILQTSAIIDRVRSDEDHIMDQHRAVLSPSIMQGIRMYAVDQPLANWLYNVYEHLNPIAAPGEPAVRRNMIKDGMELSAFVARETTGKILEPTDELVVAQFRDVANRSAILSQQERMAWACSPMYWANLRQEWPKLNERQREDVRTEWRRNAQAAAAQQEPVEWTLQDYAYGKPPTSPQDLASMMARYDAKREEMRVISNVFIEGHYTRVNALGGEQWEKR